MDLDNLRLRLAKRHAGRLADELIRWAEEDRALLRRLELVAKEEESAELAKALKRRVSALRRARSFVDRDKGRAFYRDLEGLLESLREGLLEKDPESACSILESFIQTDGATIERVHDSSGVGWFFEEACRLYLQAAARTRGERDWVERLYELVKEDEYDVRGALLRHAEALLSEHELRRLARRFEDDWRAATDSKSARLAASARLGMVAVALRDPRLYERSYSLDGRALNDLELLDVARQYLRLGHAQEAIQRLRQVSGRSFERLDLLAECYEQTGQRTERIDCLWALVERLLDWGYFEMLLELLAEEDREAARERASQIAARAEDPIRGAGFLLRLGRNEEAERLVIDRLDTLRQGFYGYLRELARLASERGAYRIEMFCYRALLEEILDEGRSRAYGHAARYFRRLAELDERVETYQPLVAHAAYVASLRDHHGRKKAFWRRVE